MGGRKRRGITTSSISFHRARVEEKWCGKGGKKVSRNLSPCRFHGEGGEGREKGVVSLPFFILRFREANVSKKKKRRKSRVPAISIAPLDEGGGGGKEGECLPTLIYFLIDKGGGLKKKGEDTKSPYLSWQRKRGRMLASPLPFGEKVADRKRKEKEFAPSEAEKNGRVTPPPGFQFRFVLQDAERGRETWISLSRKRTYWKGGNCFYSYIERGQ